MERRNALKNIGLAFGYTVATPTLIGLVQSCQNEKSITWTPSFFNKEQAIVLTQLVDILLPKTDTPSASELNVDVFIDRYANEVMDENEQEFIKMAFNAFNKEALNSAGKELAIDLSSEDLEASLAKTLKVDKQQKELNEEALEAYMEAKIKGEEIVLDDNVAAASFASNLRNITIWAYKTSEYIGEEVLAYLPVPGEYVPCGDLEELTGGKAWSI
ncbi:gluconate 2-dehydrogenase subunit 3 family protein [Eudoraea chungangensis]|uniref:gluconate 2-dehydrogenase subunit 3 family protein n=1 Tax=Eudoraea chungangensis TaxID=1481905 RepID=UPI0023EBAF38|nr:gluconate 2-dehydrogenase subunit 3 family protein [Eudoraea chungangensis]